MNHGSTLLAIASALMLAVFRSPAQNLVINTNLPAIGTNSLSLAGTNGLPLTETLKYQQAFQNDRALGERAVLPPGLKEKMRLTNTQRSDIKPIEDEFAVTSLQFQADNQARIDTAQESIRRARTSQNTSEMAIARKNLQDIWVGLQLERGRAVLKVKPLLTPEQVKILDDPQNQWRENHLNESGDPSAN